MKKIPIIKIKPIGLTENQKIYNAMSDFINETIDQEEREGAEAGSYVYDTSKRELVSAVEEILKRKLTEKEKQQVYEFAEDFGNMYWMRGR